MMTKGISLLRISKLRNWIAWFLLILTVVFVQNVLFHVLSIDIDDASSEDRQEHYEDTKQFQIFSKDREIEELNALINRVKKNSLLKFEHEESLDNKDKKTKDFVNKTLDLSKNEELPDYGAKNNNSSKDLLDFENYSTRNVDISNKFGSMSQFYTVMNNQLCFKYGIKIAPMKEYGGIPHCPCREHFSWKDCGIPAAVWDTVDRFPSSLNDIKRRNIPRRIINGVIFNHEFDMLEVRLHELEESVDLFIILESRFSSYGETKPLRLFERLKQGFLSDFHEKILYVCLSEIPDLVQNGGWNLEIFLRNYLGKKGLPRIAGLEDDDIFILSDADEIPTADVVNFLKLYDGFPEPVAFTLKWNVFGFFWNSYSKFNIPLPATVFSAASVKIIRDVFHDNVYLIRKEKILQHKKIWKDLARFKSEGGKIGKWTIGSTEHYAGWHCSWCFRPEGIILKMDSAQRNDTPRWGDYPEKRNTKYIENCIKNGRWFDDRTKFRKINNQDIMYAPSYILENSFKFEYLLQIPP